MSKLFGERFTSHANVSELFSSCTGGTADWLVVASTITDIIEAVKAACRHRIPWLVIGGGSGSLFSDYGFAGLLIVNRTSGMLFDDQSQIVVESGTGFKEIINWASTRGYGGLEDFYHLPGTVAGAIVTNAVGGTSKILDYVRELTVIYADSPGAISCRTISSNEWRESPCRPQLVILSIKLQLSYLGQPEILRRLRARGKDVRVGRHGYLGHWALPQLQPNIMLWRKTCQELFRFDERQPSVLNLRKKTTSEAILQCLQALMSQSFEQTGERLELRTSLLGYWPDNDGATKK
ncbi:hypothetical protein A3F39_01595 [Candidatus Berkelbacteria bacterium RIFCSPHIGHO2_12_FULL_50_11]|nr:MAG: hypothetical protein A3F39_01595 [Candidatus Berkelbacteria bacterium RIFCSPHIGHO2_12_FULL_50_11]